jgi:hypothetical protein
VRWMAGLPLGDLGTTARGAPVADVVLAALPTAPWPCPSSSSGPC